MSGLRWAKTLGFFAVCSEFRTHPPERRSVADSRCRNSLFAKLESDIVDDNHGVGAFVGINSNYQAHDWGPSGCAEWGYWRGVGH